MRRFLKSSTQVLKRFYACGKDPYPGINKENLRRLEMLFDRLQGSNSPSLLKKHLTPALVEDLKKIKTEKYSANILDCVRSGLKFFDSPIGTYAPEAEAYTVFKDLFDPVIGDIHGFTRNSVHPQSDFGDYYSVKNIDPRDRFIISTRMRVLRNIEGYPLAPLMTKRHYRRMETEIIPILSQLTGELKGQYFDEETLLNSKRTSWLNDHLYGVPSRFMEAANIGRFHPLGRGLYHSSDKTFSVWMNFEDHMRIVSMQAGGDVGQTYRRLINALEQLESYMRFSQHQRLGFVTCSPKHLGTAFRASVHIRLLKLPFNEAKFQEILDKYELQVRGTYGEGKPIEKAIYDISNKRTLGTTEIKSVDALCKGLQEIMRLETIMKPPCDCELLQF